ncbi:MAG: glycine oxidase ThiO [Planctomycetaceae bacterium]
MTDVVIVGGGVIGLSIAYELAGQGASVRIVEQGTVGREASWAGAGILPPGNPEFARSPEVRLRAESHILWPKLTAQLFAETGIDNGYRVCGGINVRLDVRAGELEGEIASWIDEGVEVERLDLDRVWRHEPELSRDIRHSYRLPMLGQVRNPWHLKALLAGCAARGVEVVEGNPVVGFDVQNDRVVSARTTMESHWGGQFCIAGGPWTRPLLRQFGFEPCIEPVRGQIVLLATPPGLLQHVIEDGPRYLVPRADGRILVGSTEEHVGYDRRTTAAGVAGLIRFAVERVPALAEANVEKTWAGLRPGSLDGLPYLGQVPETENLYVAAGHFRSGLQMSPFTAVLLREAILGQRLSMPLDAFACDRHQRTAVE